MGGVSGDDEPLVAVGVVGVEEAVLGDDEVAESDRVEEQTQEEPVGQIGIRLVEGLADGRVIVEPPVYQRGAPLTQGVAAGAARGIELSKEYFLSPQGLQGL